MPKAPKYPYVRRLKLRNGEVRYQGTRRVSSGRRYGPLRATAKEAHDDALSWQPQDDYRRRMGPLTFSQAAELVREELLAKQRSAGTLSWFDCHVRALLLAFKPNALLSAIGANHIELFVRERMKAVSAATVTHHLRCLSRILRYAVRKGWLHSNPLKSVDLPRVEQKKMDCFTAAEVVSLLKQIRASGHRCAEADADLLSLVFLTGLRRSELARLEPGDVSLPAGVLHVRGKTGSREVPLNAEAAEVLRRCIERANGRLTIFRGGVDGIARSFQRWQEALAEPRLHAHALRHAFATCLVRANHDVHTVAQLLGHRGLQMVVRYLHGHGDAARRAVADLKLSPGSPKLRKVAE